MAKTKKKICALCGIDVKDNPGRHMNRYHDGAIFKKAKKGKKFQKKAKMKKGREGRRPTNAF